MARQVITKKIEGATAGRDAGKVFIITEMSARAAHAWATRAIFAMMNSGVEIPDGAAAAGMAGLVSVGIMGLTKIPYEVAAPLLDELLACAAYQPDPANPSVTRAIHESDIEEFATYFVLQNAAWDVLSAPFMGAARSTSASATTAAQ